MAFRIGTALERATRSPMTAQVLGYSDAQWQTLCALRAHYRRWGDWSSVREVQRLQFARWLYTAGRLRR